MKRSARVNTIAARIGEEFGWLFINERLANAEVTDAEFKKIKAFLDRARVPIIKEILYLWDHVDGGFGCFVLGPNGNLTLRFSRDLSRWHVEGKDEPGARTGVLPLFEFLNGGRLISRGDLAFMLGLAAASAMKQK